MAGLAASTLLACASPASAATACDGDFRFWPMVAASAPVGDRLQVKADALVETTDGGARTGLVLVRAIVLREAREGVAYGGGYTLVLGPGDAGRSYVEHRAVQELDLRLVRQDGVVLSARTRLEERGRESRGGVVVRLRQQARLEAPVAGGVARAVIWTEYFHDLNGVAWSGPAGPALVLTFVGVQVPISKTLSLEPGYLSRITLASGRAQVGHVGAVTVGVRF